MRCKTSILIKEMIKYYKNDVKRINHFLKVFSFAQTIGKLEHIDENLQYILEVSSIMHDIGIKISEEKYNSSAGNYQEIEGPPVAKKMLESFNVDESIIERVCFLIGHHHTYSNIDNIDYQILIESDFLVNIYEDEIDINKIVLIRDRYFKTKSGINILNDLYL